MIRSATQNKLVSKSKRKSHCRTLSALRSSLSQGSKGKNKSKKHRRAVSSNLYCLAPLIGKKVIKAPKIYKNQIFCDVYDEIGNHDRIVEISPDESKDYDYNNHYIVPELLLLPTAGRNLYNHKKVAFFS